MSAPSPARRGVPAGVALALAAGFVALMVGIAVLAGVVVDARDDALERSNRGRETLELLAASDLEQALARDLDGVAADVDRALADPLGPDAELACATVDAVLLPRPGAVVDGAAAASRVGALLALADRDTPDIEGALPDPVERDRVVLARAAATPGGLDAWLDHRVHFALALDLELATTVLALERLEAAHALDPALAKALLRDGVRRPDGDAPGLFPALVRARARLPAEDLARLFARARAVAERVVVQVDDVAGRLATPAPDAADLATLRALAARTAATPPHASAPLLACATRCYALRADGPRVIGRAVDVARHLDALARRYVAAGRVAPEARLELARAEPLAVTIASPEWEAERGTIERRFLLEAIPLGAVAALGAAVSVLALVLQRRRAAYVDLRGQLLSVVTHELKTPLAGIRALAETLEVRLRGAPEARDYPRRIVASAERLGFLVDNVLSFARLDRGAWKPRLEPILVADLGPWLAADPVARAPRPVDLELALPPGLAVSADPDLLRLLLANLVDNAARHATADRVAIRVAAARDARGVRLTVSDDGPGLGALDPARAFALAPAPPRRATTAAATSPRGTGLGLSMCRMIVDLHGGAIAVSETGPGGTTIAVTLPAPAAAAQPSPAEESP